MSDVNDALDRVEKKLVRSLWVKKAKELEGSADTASPLYFTLPGQDGKDLKALIDGGVFKLADNGKTLHEDDSRRLVVAESKGAPAAKFKLNFPGVKVLEKDFGSIVAGTGLTTFPSGADDKRACSAKIINLDLNQCLRESPNDPGMFLPLPWVKKLSVFKREQREESWSLLLTLNGDLNVGDEAWKRCINLIANNIENSDGFAKGVEAVVGAKNFKKIQDLALPRTIDRSLKHKLMLILVPKLIVDDLSAERWSITAEWCLSYGEPRAKTAPMVTWCLEFIRSDKRPPALYESNVASLLDRVGHISVDGQIQCYA